MKRSIQSLKASEYEPLQKMSKNNSEKDNADILRSFYYEMTLSVTRSKNITSSMFPTTNQSNSKDCQVSTENGFISYVSNRTNETIPPIDTITQVIVWCNLGIHVDLNMFKDLTNLTHVYLNNCTTNSFPLGEKLEKIDLYSCKLGRYLFRNLGNLKGLTHLKISNCSMENPDSISYISNLVNFEIESSYTRESFFEELSKLKKLRRLSLTSMSISDQSSRHLSEMDSLLTLKMEMCEIPTFEHLPKFRSLSALSVCLMRLSEESFECLSRIGTLKKLSLEGVFPSQKDICTISKMRGLERLNLTSNGLTDQLIKPLCALVNLTHLNLPYNRITCEGIESISSLANLKKLGLKSNSVREEDKSRLISLFSH